MMLILVSLLCAWTTARQHTTKNATAQVV